MSCNTGKTVSSQVCIDKKIMFIFISQWQNVTRVLLRRVRTRRRNNCSFLARKFQKYRKLYITKTVGVCGRHRQWRRIGQFSMCFIFCVDSRLAADELVTATKDGSFNQKLVLLFDILQMKSVCKGIVRVLSSSYVSIRVTKRDYLHILMQLVSGRVNQYKIHFHSFFAFALL